MTEDRRQKMLTKVQALLSRAASTTFEAEADACRQKANDLMLAYSIAEFELAGLGEAEAPKPTVREVPNWAYETDLPYDVEAALGSIYRKCLEFCKVMQAPTTTYRMRVLVGLPADIDYAELMFTSLYLECVMRLAPQAESSRPMIENLVLLKETGHKWADIGERLYNIGQLDKPYTRNTGVRFTKLYADYCKANDRDQVRMHPDIYKRSFIQGFRHGVTIKLQEMMDANDHKMEGSGAGLVLRDARVDVRAFFNEMFPPPPPPKPLTADELAALKKSVGKVKYRTITYSHAATARGRAAGAEAAVSGRPGDGVSGMKRKELS